MPSSRLFCAWHRGRLSHWEWPLLCVGHETEAKAADWAPVRVLCCGMRGSHTSTSAWSAGEWSTSPW